jgi:hypothetical protein
MDCESRVKLLAQYALLFLARIAYIFDTKYGRIAKADERFSEHSVIVASIIKKIHLEKM